jgi:hypothetical protein
MSQGHKKQIKRVIPEPYNKIGLLGVIEIKELKQEHISGYRKCAQLSNELKLCTQESDKGSKSKRLNFLLSVFAPPSIDSFPILKEIYLQTVYYVVVRSSRLVPI